jgi:hypothetical protein
MSQSGIKATFNTPVNYEISIATGTPSGVINVGDWLAYSGQYVAPTYAGGLAYWKASGAGVAIEANSAYDAAGRLVANTALRFVRQGIIRVSGAASGTVNLGLGAYPASTGSGVAAPTGNTGVGATWQTGVKVSLSGSTAVGGSGVATVVGIDMTRAVAGTGEWDLLLIAPRPDYY